MIVVVQNWQYSPEVNEVLSCYSLHESFDEWRSFMDLYKASYPPLMTELYFPKGLPYRAKVHDDNLYQSLQLRKPGLWWLGSDTIPVV